MESIQQISYVLSRTFLLTLFITLFTLSSLSASNLNPLLDFCVADLQAPLSNNGYPCKSQVTSEDFFYSGLYAPLNSSNPRGLAANAANLMTFPSLYYMGISVDNVVIAAGEINPPHTHPGAAEAGVVLEGTVLVGFLTTNYTLFSKIIGPGEMFVIPPGLIHYEMNVGEKETRLLTVVNNEYPSEVLLPHTLLATKPAIPDAVLAKTFKTDSKTINMLKSKFIT